MENIRAYGAGLTSGQFDSNTFFKKPTVIFRTITLAFGVLLWFSISKGGWHRLNGSPHHQVCLYGNSASTCSFGSALGFFSVICAAALLISDAKFENISSIPTRKRVVTGDLTISAAFTAVFLIASFTFWSKFSSFDLDEVYRTGYAKFSILLAFLSTITWGGAAFFAWRRYEEGAITNLGTSYETDFAGIPTDVGDGYGYGGDSDGIGAASATNTSYQAGVGGPTTGAEQNPNPFVGTEGYGY